MTTERVGRLEERLDRLEAAVNEVRQELRSLRDKVDDHFKWIIGITITMWATTMAAVIASLFR